MTESKSSFIYRMHGANPEKLYQSMGLQMPRRIIDFSTNTNIFPWSGNLNIDLMKCISNYPDDESLELRHFIAEREFCGIESVLFLNGSNEGVYILSSFFTGKSAAVLQPAYGEYRMALSSYGAEITDVFKLEDTAAGFDIVFICNPCNPTGLYIPAREIEALASRCPATVFVIDEAYVDFLPNSREYARVDFTHHSNIVILRSLTKMYHMSGARLGYILTSPERAALLKTRQPTWSVNAVAHAAGMAFLKDGAFASQTREYYAQETPRFIKSLRDAGITVRPTDTHFFLIEVDDDEAVIKGLLEQGLVVRHTRNFPGLEGSCIRVATLRPWENSELVKALAGWDIS